MMPLELPEPLGPKLFIWGEPVLRAGAWCRRGVLGPFVFRVGCFCVLFGFCLGFVVLLFCFVCFCVLFWFWWLGSDYVFGLRKEVDCQKGLVLFCFFLLGCIEKCVQKGFGSGQRETRKCARKLKIFGFGSQGGTPIVEDAWFCLFWSGSKEPSKWPWYNRKGYYAAGQTRYVEAGGREAQPTRCRDTNRRNSVAMGNPPRILRR